MLHRKHCTDNETKQHPVSFGRECRLSKSPAVKVAVQALTHHQASTADGRCPCRREGTCQRGRHQGASRGRVTQ